ncbi:MAG: hypothetical protein Q9199_000368 [Rusavskia elegans]
MVVAPMNVPLYSARALVETKSFTHPTLVTLTALRLSPRPNVKLPLFCSHRTDRPMIRVSHSFHAIERQVKESLPSFRYMEAIWAVQALQSLESALGRFPHWGSG